MVDCKTSRSASPVHRRRGASSTHCGVTALGLSCTVLSEDPFLWTQLVGLSDEKILRAFFFGVDVVGKVADIIVHVHCCCQVLRIFCIPFLKCNCVVQCAKFT